MKPFWTRKDFKVQQALWYELLKVGGFDDIEYGCDTDSTLYLQDDGTRYRRERGHSDLHVGPEIVEHARGVGERVNFFTSLEERFIWRRTTEGAELAEIASEIDRSRVHVWRVIKRVKERMHG